MEGEQKPASPSMSAAPKGKTMWMVATIIVAILLAASVIVLGVLPALTPQTAVSKFSLVALDFAYDRIGFNPSHTVKVGQPIWIVFSNTGTNVHEFLLFTNKDAALTAAKEDLATALADHPTWASNATEKAVALDEYNTLHDADPRLVRYDNIDRNVDPDNTTDLLFVIHEAGTYFFACHQVDSDATPMLIHQDHGMWGTLIVAP